MIGFDYVGRFIFFVLSFPLRWFGIDFDLGIR